MEILRPYSSEGTEGVSVRGDFIAVNDGFEVRFELKDARGQVRDSLREGVWTEPRRTHGLWRTTCFEAFWGTPNHAAYWELNISAAGEWNIYLFDAYREPQPPREDARARVTRIQSTPTSLRASITGVPVSAFEVSLCAVVSKPEGPCYFSTAHKGEKPDFHLRESFILRRTT